MSNHIRRDVDPDDPDAIDYYMLDGEIVRVEGAYVRMFKWLQKEHGRDPDTMDEQSVRILSRDYSDLEGDTDE